jgi:acetyl-CoA carboxylase carboxyl transferase subunit alpha
MLENAVYSVITPEGCASILWKDTSIKRIKEASECLKMTAEICFLSASSKIIPEERDVRQISAVIREELVKTIKNTKPCPRKRF